jgi:XTP/dITP diphosphohydrolase
MQLLVATTNPGKQREISAILSQANISVVTPQELTKVAELAVEETGETFEENALLKARAFAQISELITVADDSGLEVTCLNGFPGVRSGRWHPGSSKERVQGLLDKLQSESDRRATFVTVICLYNPQENSQQFFRGEVAGTLTKEMRGETGFDYDYIFIPDGYTQTFAELGPEFKNKLSHRAAAIQKLKVYLETSTK